ncbi:phosphatidylinositol N-acetylglucosaminyltransferase [Lactarius akahatsu]|uniref:Phosphatidylinositol N-acetylglucosaminyltransferase n=1 Tax=Lactarius akahatsu TaxID=416441 RepID=A0AAD4LDN3_9AGAM|nr:phosphatidylinositol N-acetylglucosaminyltransferase [Lactarius akahatsu]
MTSVNNAPPEWERVLWRPQPFPDNYVPPSFLSALSKNPNVLPYRYWPLVLGACAISQNLSVVFIFLAVFTRLLDHTLDPRLLVALSTAGFIGGCLVWELMGHFESDAASSERRTCFSSSIQLNCANRSCSALGARTVKASLLVFLALIALAPILRTLTAPTSADSIWALATALFLVHAALADYTYSASPVQRERLTSVLSTNAAISATVVLASRLHNDLAVFALMLFSVEAFALFPVLRRCLQQMMPAPVQALVTGTLGLAALAAPLPGLCAAVLVSVTFGAPAALIWAQQYKHEIRGPWDAATPRGFEGDSGAT